LCEEKIKRKKEKEQKLKDDKWWGTKSKQKTNFQNFTLIICILPHQSPPWKKTKPSHRHPCSEQKKERKEYVV